MRRTTESKPNETNKIQLPPGMLVSDTKYPQFEWTVENSKKPENKIIDQFNMYYTQRFGWCIATLPIRSGRSRGREDRTYGIDMNGGIVTMGMGPHVLKTITVYVTQARVDKLQHLLELKKKGETAAGEIRDRISTRRAATILRRNVMGGDHWF